MKIKSNSIINGYFNNEIGHHGSQFLKGKKPNFSFHLAWEDIPENTKSLAIIFLDHDAIPVCGFSFSHWTVANIDPSVNELPENASVTMSLLEGVTSWGSGIISEDWRLEKEDATGFGGCAPPDKDHLYTITLYALDTKLALSRGFYMNDLLKTMKGHILETASLEAMYRSK